MVIKVNHLNKVSLR